MESVINPYFSVELCEKQINKIRKEILLILKEFNFKIQELNNPHISVSYVLGKVNLEKIEDFAEEIIEAPFSMKIIGLERVESKYYGGTIISLSLEHSDDFLYSQEYLKEVLTNEDENVSIKNFKNGFLAHISLFVIKDLYEKDKFPLLRYLEISLNDLSDKEVSGEKFCIYDSNRNKLIEKYFK